MEYRYKKNQIFKKVLPVPNHIRLDVYDCKLSFHDYMIYQLEDKVPLSCLNVTDRQIVDRFGLDRAKELDWSLIEVVSYRTGDLKTLLLSLSPETEDLNDTLYKALNHKLAPQDYSKGMKKKYPNREIEIINTDSPELKNIKFAFNNGSIQIMDIIRYWDVFKDKDLTYVLSNDKDNNTKITDKEFKEFMKEFKNTALVIASSKNIYDLLGSIKTSQSEDERLEILKNMCEEILAKTDINDPYTRLNLENKQYKELFKYVSMKEYLSRNRFNTYDIEEIYKDLEYDGLTQEYLLDSLIQFELLKNYDVLSFIRTYGAKNILEFDEECGNFFTKNNCYMLTRMYDLYMHYAGNDHNPKTTFYTQKTEYDKDGNIIERPYTKDEFYEAMKRMIIGGPTDFNFKDSAPDYRQMTGEFKRRNSSLFLDSNAPEDLKTLFYTKSLTPSIIRDNPEYIKYLEGKDLSSCFKGILVRENRGDDFYDFENLYTLLSRKTDFENVMEIIKEYSDSLKLIFSREVATYYDYNLKFEKVDTIDQVTTRINDLIIKILIEKGLSYPQNIPSKLYKEHPEIFLSNDAPIELQKAFYSRTLTTKLLLENKEYGKYLEGKDLQLIYKYMPIPIFSKEKTGYYHNCHHSNLVKIIQETFKDDALQTMLEYGKYIESLYNINSLKGFQLTEGYSKDDILDTLDDILLNGIIKNNLKYDDKMSGHFKGKNPTLFLDDSVSQEIKDKFYNREFTIQDFNDNKELLDILGDTNIVCGFNENLAWLIPLINGDNHKLNNLTRLKVLTEYYKIQDAALQEIYKEYIEKYKEDVNLESLSSVCEILTRLSLSNSTEMFNFRKELAHQILNTANPIDSLKKVEAIFIKNNIPTVGKVYSCFEILHPDFQGFNMASTTISPTLKESGNKKRKFIVFNDLLKASFGSNNKSINNYISAIDKGNKLYKKVKEENISFESLSLEEQETLKKFRRIINTLYDKTLKGKTKEDNISFTNDVIGDIKLLEEKLAESPDSTYDLADRVVRMFCGGTGIDTIEEARKYMYEKISSAEKRNIAASSANMILEEGDLVKGINDIKYLRNILQNGSVSKEFLGSYAASDATPLDTDVSMILSNEGSTREIIGRTNANSYGNIWLVLKNDGRFDITRQNGEETSKPYDHTKLELFHTGVLGSDHYGIRTGFASSEINYIVMEKYDTRVGLEIALNGFYIPVADKDGKIVFTKEDYDNIRSKMAGLTYYDETTYTFSENLVTEEIETLAKEIEQSNKETKHKREIINKVIKEALDELGLTLKTQIDGDLTENYVELIDTGSTGRGTNKPNDGDFDFMMRLDRAIMQDSKKLQALKQKILEKLGINSKTAEISSGDFRIKNVTIEDITVDIDITFTTKTDTVLYSTDMSLQDRLETIKKQDERKYNYVVANILQAKKVLKDAHAYKPNRGDNPEGGLGGVGIENWILQHGGSFYDAAKSFVAAAEGKSFEDFLHTYEVWDFGDNHLAEKKAKYPHDEFITSNMSREGFLKMTNALKEYIKEAEKNKFQTVNYQI